MNSRVNPKFVVINLCLSSLLFITQVNGQDSLERNYADQLQRIAPRDPDAAIDSFEIIPGLRMELMASEPMVMDPVAMTFDEWGRAYVVEMRGYSEQAGQKLGRVKMLLDTDHDGKFDKSTVFADQFRWPTAVVCAFGGILVGDAPDIVFLKDEDGDGKSDTRKTVTTGFGTSNVQQLPNNFQWGIDNRIYGASGGNGGRLRQVGVPGIANGNLGLSNQGNSVAVNGRDFSIDPKTFRIEAIAGGTQFGMTFDRWGNRYVCSNSDHCQEIVFEEKYSARNPQQRINRSRISIADDGPAAQVFRISPIEPWRKVRTRLRVQGLVRGPVEGGGRAAGYFTSASGLTCYDGDLLPAEYAGDMFVGDVGSNLVHRKKLIVGGIQNRAVRTEMKAEFLRSTDNWFRPVQMASGPDGSLIILDMYRETIEHPASLPPIIKMHLDLNSGNNRGRIYRVLPFEGVIPMRLLPGNANSKQLVEMLSHPNGWHRRTAARVLTEKRYLKKNAPTDEDLIRALGLSSDSPLARIHSMYLLSDQVQLRNQDLVSLLKDNHPQVRIHALRIAESKLNRDLEKQIAAMTADQDVRVRYQVALTLGEFDSDNAAAITDLATSDGLDPWMRTALANSAYSSRAETIQSLVERIRQNKTARDVCRPLLLDLTAQVARSAGESELQVVADVLQAWPDNHELLLGEMIVELMRTPAKKLERLRILLEMRSVPLDQLVQQATTKARLDAVTDWLAIADRIVAVKLLSLDRPDAIGDIVTTLLELNQPPAIKRSAISLAGQFASPKLGEALLVSLRILNPQLRSAALNVLLARESWTIDLLEKIESGEVSSVFVDASTRQRLSLHSNHAIQAKAKQLFGVDQRLDRDELVQRYIKQIERHDGDIIRGRDLFRKSCVSCHRLEGHGNKIGPNLAAFANRGTAAMITNILDPNREVDPRYLAYQIQLKDGRTMMGVISHETSTTLGLQDNEGKIQTILRNEIELMQSTTLSLMPENFDKEIGTRSMADLIEYLANQVE